LRDELGNTTGGAAVSTLQPLGQVLV
jgi:hypothetical protein